MIKILMPLLLLLFSDLFCFEPDKEKTYTIAFAQDTMNNDYRIAQVKSVQTALEPYKNIRFIYSDAKASGALQAQQVEDFIDMGVDLIMISPYNEMTAAPVINKAHQHNIPVILVDRGVQGSAYTTYIHPDNYAIAREAAEYLLEKIDYNGTVLMLEGVPHADVTRKRREGFMEVAQKYKAVTVIPRTANFLRRDAILVMEQLHTDGIVIDAIFSQSDSMLSGVRVAAPDLDVPNVGIDYISEAKDAIAQGRQDASFVYSLCSEEAVEAALKILSGIEVPKEILVDSARVTKENCDDVEPIF